jgi:TetR/AcrR family transcriptional regulator, cholesterol catabolism regulator
MTDEAEAQPAERRPRGRPRLTEPSAEYRRRMDEIVSTAIDVFRRDGYDTGSLDDVADQLGLRKSSLYHYVGSKAELLFLIFDRAITVALERLEELTGIADPEQRLRALIAHQVALMTDEPQLFAVFFDSRPRLAVDYERDIRAKERRYVRIYAVAAAGAAGVIPPIDPRYGAQGLLGMLIWVYKWFEPGRDDAEAVTQAFMDLVIRGHQDGVTVSLPSRGTRSAAAVEGAPVENG